MTQLFILYLKNKDSKIWSTRILLLGFVYGSVVTIFLTIVTVALVRSCSLVNLIKYVNKLSEPILIGFPAKCCATLMQDPVNLKSKIRRHLP